MEPIYIRIELERMKQSIMTAVLDYDRQIENQLSRNLQNIVDNFDFETLVKETANAAIRNAVDKAIRNYFQYGEGADAIRESVATAIYKTLHPND